MRRILLPIGLILCLLLGMVPAIVHAQDDDTTIRLIPFSSREMNISGVRPDGWEETSIGTFANEALGGVILQQAFAPSLLPQIIEGLLEHLNMEAFPESTGVYRGEFLTWNLYPTMFMPEGEQAPAPVIFALSETEDKVYFAALFAEPPVYDFLHDTVFLPALDVYREGLDPLLPSTDPANIRFIPFNREAMAADMPPLTGLRPAGWRTITPGIYRREIPGEQEALIRIETRPGMTRDEIAAQLEQNLQAAYRISALPRGASYEAENGLWTVYRLDNLATANQRVTILAGVTVTEGMGYRVQLLLPPTDDIDALYEAIMIPVMASIGPDDGPGKQDTSEAPPTHTPLVLEDLAISSALPAGWQQVRPGLYSAPDTPSIGLLFRTSNKIPSVALADFSAEFNLPNRPEAAGDYTTPEGIEWARYTAEWPINNDTTLLLEVAATRGSGQDTVLIVLQTMGGPDHDALIQSALHPALDYFRYGTEPAAITSVPAAAPASTVPMKAVSMPEIGVAGVVPEGLVPVFPGYFRDPEEQAHVLLFQLSSKAPAVAMADFAASNGLEDFTLAGAYSGDSGRWQLYELYFEDAGTTYVTDVAVSTDRDRPTLLVLLQSQADLRAERLETILYPVLDQVQWPLVADAVTIDFAPLYVALHDVAGIIPAGWQEINPGAFVAPDGATTLAYQFWPGMAEDDALASLAAQWQINVPRRTRIYATDAARWDIYEFGGGLDQQSKIIGLASATVNDGTVFVILQAYSALYPAYYDALLIPALDALHPLNSALPEPVELEPYVNPSMHTAGLSGAIPSGWTPTDSEREGGYFASPDQQVMVRYGALAEVGAMEALSIVANNWLGFEGQISSSTYTSPATGLTWVVAGFQSVRHPEIPNSPLDMLDLAFLETPHGVIVLEVWSVGQLYRPAHIEVFLPMLDAIAPPSSDAPVSA
jgi:hypothetical protein